MWQNRLKIYWRGLLLDKERINKFIGCSSMPVVDAMAKIDANAKGILFITDKDDKLDGCISDGDIRRWLIKTGDLSAPVKNAMSHPPKFLFSDERQKAEKFMRQELITAVPIINNNGYIKDIVLLCEITETNLEKSKKDLSGVPVIIMAGGKGTRLYPYTKILPKPLIPIGDTPIVERIINCFSEYGINKYYMTVNYKKGMIKSYFTDLQPGYDIKYVEESKPLGTGGSIKLIEEKFNIPLFVTNCDSLVLTDYGELYDFHIKSGNVITIVSALKNIVVPYGVLYSKENGEVSSMDEKPRLSYFINTGMYIINPETIEKIPDNTFFHMTHLVDAVMSDGLKVGMYPISEDSFLDMGEFNEMQRMERKLDMEKC